MTTGHLRRTGLYVAACVLAVLAVLAPARAPSQESTGAALLRGSVRDSNGRPLVNATVVLEVGPVEQAAAAPAQNTHTDSDGRYRFAALQAGAYRLRAEMTGYSGAAVAPVNLAKDQTLDVDLTLIPAKASAQAPEFFDEPQFTVAGVTQASNSGGHGSDVVLRTTEALAKATVSLSKDRDKDGDRDRDKDKDSDSGKQSSAGSKSPAAASPTAATESSLLQAVALNPQDPALHHRLGDVEEDLGKPLEAVREYQRAAELDPGELYLFDWGTELLNHRALEPATEVFTKGNRLFPKSVRMLVALGVAWYARGSYDQAAQCLANASDLAPDNPTPYLFLGKMQSVETPPSELSVARLARFVQLQPENALANYYYAVSLWKQSAALAGDGTDKDNANHNSNSRSAHVESLLLKAVHLDPKLGAAYLQLGILYSRGADFSRAIPEYRKAIDVSSEEVSPQLANPPIDETLAEAHYRLAQAYLRTGDKAHAQEELEVHALLIKKTNENTERQRREIQEFVVSLRGKNSASQ